MCVAANTETVVFPDTLVKACAALVREWQPEPYPEWIAAIPSLRNPNLVPDFARRLASALDLPYRDALTKKEQRPAQKTMHNSDQQARNVLGSLGVHRRAMLPGSVLLVDDMVASRVANAGRSVVSGAAQGVDQAAMNAALDVGGKVTGVLTGNLERTTMRREHRDLLLAGRLVLVSPYDPCAAFNVGHAMQRNKTIYALADAALVINATTDRGGTWAGAVEQLRKYPTPVYVRSTGAACAGLDALRAKGALPWPNPDCASAIDAFFDAAVGVRPGSPVQPDMFDHSPPV